ncbi:MAG TPA: hypothetical protein ENN69_00780 [Spirochaetia bacterium]|nr:hypothetical protein [Spirochaetia bacterium]
MIEVMRKTTYARLFRIVILTVLIIALIATTAGCGGQPAVASVARGGVIDLTGTSLDAAEPLELTGTWEFYWQKLVDPAAFQAGAAPAPDALIRMPRYWNEVRGKEGVFPSSGYATYHCVLQLRPGMGNLAFSLADVFSAYDLYLNGRLVLSNGRVGKEAAAEYARIIPRTVYFRPDTETLHLTLHVSNHLSRDAGIGVFRLGGEERVRRMDELSVAGDLFLFGAILIVGLYHLLLFLLRRDNSNFLFFGLFCLATALRTALMGRRLAQFLFPSLTAGIFSALEYLTIPLMVISLSAFFLVTFRIKWFRPAHYIVIGLSGVYLFFLVATPPNVSAVALSIYQTCILAFGILLVVMHVGAIRNGTRGAVGSLISFLPFFATAVNDILHYNQVINTFYMIPWGVFLLILFQAGNLAVQFSRNYRAVQVLSERLTALDKLKDAVLANTSHEIRTPLVGIIGIAESVLEGATGRVNEELARKMHIIIAGSRRLSNLLNDILDFTRLKYKELELARRPVDFKKLCDTAFLFSRPLTAGKDIVLENRIPPGFPEVAGDPARLQQILHNLIDNAIKFTEQGGVTVTAYKMGSTGWFSVADTGRGDSGGKTGPDI